MCCNLFQFVFKEELFVVKRVPLLAYSKMWWMLLYDRTPLLESVLRDYGALFIPHYPANVDDYSW